MDWTTRTCRPCEGGTPALDAAQVDAALADLAGWEARDGHTRIHRKFRFRDFREAMAFVNAMAELAEREGHHPDFAVHWSVVDVDLWTHAIGGLSENDLIVAAKVGALPEARGAAPAAR